MIWSKQEQHIYRPTYFTPQCTQILEDRAKDKRENLEAVKKLRKGRASIVEDGDDFDIAIDNQERGTKRKASGQAGKPNHKRQQKVWAVESVVYGVDVYTGVWRCW